MSKTVWKFEVDAAAGEVLPQMPTGAQVLSAQNQREVLVVYALVDPGQPLAPRRLFVVATGEHFRDLGASRFIDTVQFDGGAYVVHVFEAP